MGAARTMAPTFRLLAVCAAVCLHHCLGEFGEVLVLVQEAVQVRSHLQHSSQSAAAESSNWWIFGRHRRAKREAEVPAAVAAAPPTTEFFAEDEQIKPDWPPILDLPKHFEANDAGPFQQADEMESEDKPWPALLSEVKPAATAAAAAAEEAPAVQAEVPSAPLEAPPAQAKAPAAAAPLAQDPQAVANLVRAAESRAFQNSTQTQFKVGEEIEIIDLGRNASQLAWVDCTVAGRGNATDTYSVHVPSAPEGAQDYPNVPRKYLRRHLPKGKPAFFAYQVGDQMEVKITSGPKNGTWVPCSILARGTSPDTYTIHVSFAPPGQEDISGVPGASLRTYSAARSAEAQQKLTMKLMDARSLANSDDFRGTWLGDEFQRMADAQSKYPTFVAGDAAQVQINDGPMKGSWIPCVIQGNGSQAQSYNIAVGSKDIKDVYVGVLRKALQAAPMEPPAEYSAGEVAKLVLPDREGTSRSIQVTVVSKASDPNTYNVKSDLKDLDNIPAAFLRKMPPLAPTQG